MEGLYLPKLASSFFFFLEWMDKEMGFVPTERINYNKSYHIPAVCFVLRAFVWSVRAPGAGNELGGFCGESRREVRYGMNGQRKGMEGSVRY